MNDEWIAKKDNYWMDKLMIYKCMIDELIVVVANSRKDWNTHYLRFRTWPYLRRSAVFPAGCDMGDHTGVTLFAHINAIDLDNALTRV